MKKLAQLLSDRNIAGPFDQDLGRGNKPGIIYFANEDRFTANHLSEPLTGYIVGWQDPENLEALLEAIAPEVPAGRFFSYRLMENTEMLLSETEDDLRAIGSPFSRVSYTGTTAEGKTDNRGLTFRMDFDEYPDSEQNRQTFVRILTQRLMRNRIRRAIALIDAGAANTAKTWNAVANPDSDMRAMRIAGADSAGIYANRVVIGEAAWQKRLDAYEGKASDDAGYAAAQAALARDEAGLARYLGADSVTQVKARYQNTASTKAGIVGAKVFSYFADSGLMPMDPSNVKRFVSNTRSGGKLAVYIEEHPKYVDLTVECYERLIVTATVGMRKLTIG